MSLGFSREIDLVNLGDSAEIHAYLYDGDDAPADPDDVIAVSFDIQAPDTGIRDTVPGSVEDDGSGLLIYNSTGVIGQYRVVATFTLIDGARRSTRADFEVIDPFNPPAPSDVEVVAQSVWGRVEDCFDAEDEGPWLRDMTLNTFNEAKMGQFIAEGLFELNERNPPTSLVVGGFFVAAGDPNTDFPLLVQATFLPVIRHLMRSYVEQPQAQNAPVAYEDRRDYLQRWGAIYQIEKEVYNANAALFKRRYLGLGSSKLLVDTKAGRLLPAPLRARTTGRGYY